MCTRLECESRERGLPRFWTAVTEFFLGMFAKFAQTDKFAKVGKIDIPNGKYNCKNVFVIIIAIIIATSRKYFRNEESEADLDIAMNFSAWTCQESSSKKS